MRKGFIRLLLICLYLIVNSVSYASPLTSCVGRISSDLLRAKGSANTMILDSIEQDLNVGDRSMGAMGEYLIMDAAHDRRNKSVEISAYSSNASSKVQKISINAIPVPEQHINFVLEDIMLLAPNDYARRLISGTFLNWYTTRFRSGKRTTVIMGYSSERIYGVGTRDVIGISHRLVRRNRINPVAFLHEIMHAYLDAHDADISDRVLEEMRNSLTLMRKKWVDRMVKKHPGFKVHYILRAWQRQNLKGKDEYLTKIVSDAGKEQEMIEEGALFGLGDNKFEISKLFPMLHTLESVVAHSNISENTERTNIELAISTGAYGIQLPDTAVDLVIVDESGDRIASVVLFPLKKSDGRSHDNRGVFLGWFSVDKDSLRGKYGFGQNLYFEIIEVLANLGYEKIYGVIRRGSEGFWDNMGWRPSEKEIYIPGADTTLFYSEKPDGSKNASLVADLHEADIASMKTSSSGIDEQIRLKLESLKRSFLIPREDLLTEEEVDYAQGLNLANQRDLLRAFMEDEIAGMIEKGLLWPEHENRAEAMRIYFVKWPTALFDKDDPNSSCYYSSGLNHLYINYTFFDKFINGDADLFKSSVVYGFFKGFGINEDELLTRQRELYPNIDFLKNVTSKHDAWKALRYKNHKSRFLWALDVKGLIEYLNIADYLGDSNSEKAFIYYHICERLKFRSLMLSLSESEDQAGNLKLKSDLSYEKMYDEIFKVVLGKNSKTFVGMFDINNHSAYLGDLFGRELKLELILRYSEKTGVLDETLSRLSNILKLREPISIEVEESFYSLSRRMIDIERQNRARRIERSTMPIDSFLAWVGRSIYHETKQKTSPAGKIKQDSKVITLVRQAA